MLVLRMRMFLMNAVLAASISLKVSLNPSRLSLKSSEDSGTRLAADEEPATKQSPQNKRSIQKPRDMETSKLSINQLRDVDNRHKQRNDNKPDDDAQKTDDQRLDQTCQGR